jgi:sulfur carrier protein ThiS adenylyltransferase
MQLNPDIAVHAIDERFKRSSEQPLSRDHELAVFCCVDSITTRRLIWDTLKRRAELWADGRMSAEVLRVLASSHPISDGYFETTLFGDSEAFVGMGQSK